MPARAPPICNGGCWLQLLWPQLEALSRERDAWAQEKAEWLLVERVARAVADDAKSEGGGAAALRAAVPLKVG